MPDSCHYLTVSHVYSHPCPVTLLSLYFNSNIFFLHTCAHVPTIIVHKCVRICGKRNKYRQVTGINKFLLAETVYKLFDANLS